MYVSMLHMGSKSRLDRLLNLLEALCGCHPRPDCPALVSLLRRILQLPPPKPWVALDGQRGTIEPGPVGSATCTRRAYRTMQLCMGVLELMGTTGRPCELHVGVYTLLDVPGVAEALDQPAGIEAVRRDTGAMRDICGRARGAWRSAGSGGALLADGCQHSELLFLALSTLAPVASAKAPRRAKCSGVND